MLLNSDAVAKMQAIELLCIKWTPL